MYKLICQRSMRAGLSHFLNTLHLRNEIVVACLINKHILHSVMHRKRLRMKMKSILFTLIITFLLSISAQAKLIKVELSATIHTLSVANDSVALRDLLSPIFDVGDPLLFDFIYDDSLTSSDTTIGEFVPFTDADVNGEAGDYTFAANDLSLTKVRDAVDYVFVTTNSVTSQTSLPNGIKFHLLNLYFEGINADNFTFKNGDIFDLTNFDGAKILSLDLSDTGVFGSDNTASLAASINTLTVTVLNPPTHTSSPLVLSLILISMAWLISNKKDDQ